MNPGYTDKALPVKTANRISLPSSCFSETASSFSCKISLFVTVANQVDILLITYASLALFGGNHRKK